MQRIAADFAKGRPREPWFGAKLIVWTEKVLGRRQRDILVSSLPEWVSQALAINRFRFRFAAEQAMPNAELGPSDFMLLHRASQDGFAPAEFINGSVAYLCQGAPLLRASRERFDLMMDNFYGWGFRDPALPGVAIDYRDFLDRSRRHLGMSGRFYECVLVELAGVDRPERLDGESFVRVAEYLMQLGLPWTLPSRDLMDRETMGILHEACDQIGLPYAEHAMTVTQVGGGTIHTRDLDVSGWCRVRAVYLKAGYRERPPTQRVPGNSGFITQPQANLIWRLWCQRTGQGRDRSAEALDLWLGGAGALASLTLAGAQAVLTDQLRPVIELRLAAIMMLNSANGEPVLAY